MCKLLLLTIIFIVVISHVSGHGRLLEPVGRASRWRYDSSAPRDYDDNQSFCGGFYVQWNENNGNCGFCGDNWKMARPRPHEHGGTYGQGVIVRSYKSGATIPVTIELTANHYGYFYYQLCNMDAYSGRESDACFSSKRLLLSNGQDRYQVSTSAVGLYKMNIKLPSNLRCKHCVFQWTYNVGNSWGVCDDGTGAMGCGAQETFRSCADITIT